MIKPANSFAQWPSLMLEGWRLWADSTSVIWMRMLKLSQGGPLADKETHRMIAEKVDANLMLGWALMPAMLAGASNEVLAKRAIAHYGTRVRSNQRRLSRRK